MIHIRDKCSDTINNDSDSCIDNSSYEEFSKIIDTRMVKCKGRKFIDSKEENAHRIAEGLPSLKEIKASESSRSTNDNNLIKEETLSKQKLIFNHRQF